MARLTDKLVKALPAPASSNKITYDDVVMGFGVRVTAAGARAFVLNYRRKADGRERRFTIGAFPDWSVGAAREEAKVLKRAIDGGADPVGEHKATRQAPSVADLCERFIADYLGSDSKLRRSTSSGYRSNIEADIKPRLGKLKVAAVSFSDIENLHRQVSKERGKYSANRIVGLLSRMFNLAVRWRWRPDNPAKGIERHQEHKRERYLSGEELARLTAALAADTDQQAANIFRMLLLTGARRSEVLAARWADFDIEAGIWTKPGAQTKQKTVHRVPLSAPALALLTSIERGGEFVFPGRNSHRKRVQEEWARVRKAAGIRDMRVHDLRHSYASHLASAGVGLHVIGALLGHTQPQTTARYAHLVDSALREATERAGAIVMGRRRA
jgi:integrase